MIGKTIKTLNRNFPVPKGTELRIVGKAERVPEQYKAYDVVRVDGQPLPSPHGFTTEPVTWMLWTAADYVVAP